LAVAERRDEGGVGAGEHGASQLDGDLAFKDKIGGPGENDVGKAVA
jgi:hypothetical protein